MGDTSTTSGDVQSTPKTFVDDINSTFGDFTTRLSNLHDVLKAKAGPILSDEGNVLNSSVQVSMNELAADFDSLKSKVSDISTKIHDLNNTITTAAPAP